MEIIRVIMPILLSIAEMVVESLGGEIDFVAFQEKLAKKLQEVGRAVTQAVLEGLEEQTRKDRKKRAQWQLCRRKDPKELLSRFGIIHYARSYYRNKETGKYAYLVDEQVGYSSHMRLDGQVKAKLVAAAADVSYQKSAESVARECGESISKQSVLQALRRFERPALVKQERKVSHVLYIEADEDHVASQSGLSMEARLVYVHEGWMGTKRRELKSPFYLSSVNEDVHVFWERVWDEIDARYELDKVKEVLVMGDGAAWIRGAMEVFPGARFVLDRFHLMKYVKKAVGSHQERSKKLLSALAEDNRAKVYELLSQEMEEATVQSRKETIGVAWKYIDNQWNGIRQLYRETELRCSAEGHVSHVLSERLSSRPMGWSQSGAKHMANVRVCQANGIDLVQEYLRQNQFKALPQLDIDKQILRVQRKKLQKVREVLGNIPVFKGAKSYLYEALQGLSGMLA